MWSICRLFSLVCLAFALLALAGLLGWDAFHGFSSTSRHLDLSALALLLIGAAYIFIHLGPAVPRNVRAKAIFLGAAFFLWGTEQFLPASPLNTLIDCLAIGIFVVDLGLSTIKRLQSNHERGDE